MKDPWLNHMRNLVEEHSETPPEGLWDELETTLFSEKSESNTDLPITPIQTSIKPKYKVKSWSLIAAALLLLISIGGGYFFWTNQNESSITHTASNHGMTGKTKSKSNAYSSADLENDVALVTTNDSQNAENDRSENPTLRHNDVSKLLSEKIAIQNPLSRDFLENITKESINKNSPKINLNSDNSKNPNDKFNEQIATKKQDKLDAGLAKEKDNSNNKSEREKSVSEDLEQKAIIAELTKEIEKFKTKKEPSNKQWIAGVQTSGLSISSSEALNGYYSIARHQMSLAPIVMGNAAYWQSPYTDLFVRNQGKEVHTEIKHRNLVSVGATLQYQLSNRWVFSSGIQYTKLVSDLKAGTTENYVKSEQVIQYMGVPINFNYNFITKEKWNSYVSLGGQIDQPIDGILKTKYVSGVASTHDENQKIKGLKTQFSTSAGIGAQYNFTPRLGVYAEPMMVYYLDNGSEIGSVYKEKPLNFHLRMGLRWNLSK